MIVFVTVTFPAIGLEKRAKTQFEIQRSDLNRQIHNMNFLKTLDWTIDGSPVPQGLLSKCIHFDKNYEKVVIEDGEGCVLDVWQRRSKCT